MKMTKRQKVLAGLCMAGVAVFAYDRIQPAAGLAGPEQAAASPLTSETPAPAATGETAANSLPDLGIQSHKVIAQRLAMLMNGDFPQTDDIRDAFYASGLQPPAVPVAAATPTAAAPTTLDKPRKAIFADSHQLRAVLVGSEGRMAVMDNTCLRIGQKLEEFQLVSVGERSATFSSGGGDRVTFALPVKQDGP
jgi:hypothetical protein